MSPFNRLPGFKKSALGFECKVLKKLPHIFLIGTTVLLVLLFNARSDFFGLDIKDALVMEYTILGSLLFHWMCTLGIGLFCIIVWVMKGPAYVMDPYFLPEES
ncbi:hypothetical protein Q8A64_17825 [Oxalobacteraceae bacterium R-40]|uniref:Uncharacterized protein n=1 Tax=Keguizhuia sedimenti TaxID=3064264 RepID=A0ABU1BTC9_9BURK|nr:hypothetical protein [Oxalobacteraceae bacterium R-40]